MKEETIDTCHEEKNFDKKHTCAIVVNIDRVTQRQAILMASLCPFSLIDKKTEMECSCWLNREELRLEKCH